MKLEEQEYEPLSEKEKGMMIEHYNHCGECSICKIYSNWLSNDENKHDKITKNIKTLGYYYRCQDCNEAFNSDDEEDMIKHSKYWSQMNIDFQQLKNADTNLDKLKWHKTFIQVLEVEEKIETHYKSKQLRDEIFGQVWSNMDELEANISCYTDIYTLFKLKEITDKVIKDLFNPNHEM